MGFKVKNKSKNRSNFSISSDKKDNLSKCFCC